MIKLTFCQILASYLFEVVFEQVFEWFLTIFNIKINLQRLQLSYTFCNLVMNLSQFGLYY